MRKVKAWQIAPLENEAASETHRGAFRIPDECARVHSAVSRPSRRRAARNPRGPQDVELSRNVAGEHDSRAGRRPLEVRPQ